MRIDRSLLRLDRRGEVRVPARCPAGCVLEAYTKAAETGLPTYLRRPLVVRPGRRAATLVFDTARLTVRG